MEDLNHIINRIYSLVCDLFHAFVDLVEGVLASIESLNLFQPTITRRNNYNYAYYSDKPRYRIPKFQIDKKDLFSEPLDFIALIKDEHNARRSY